MVTNNVDSCIEFTIRAEYSFEHGLNFVLVNCLTGEVMSSSRDLPSLLRSINQAINAEIFVSCHAF